MIRVLLSADLHYHVRSRPALERFAQQVQRERPDCLVLAGDIGHPLANFQRALSLFAGLSCPRLALAGNHDVWSGDHSSQSLWEHLLEETARQAGFVWLDREVFRLGSLGICGTIGWYDYSARDPSVPLRPHDYFINKGMFNNDGNYVDWDATDQEFAAQVLHAFNARLDKLCRDPAISQILVVTHVPPFTENLEQRPGDLAWSFGNAYFGNFTLGQAIIRCPKVTHVVSGHIHRGGRWSIPAPHGLVESYVVGSDYGRPAYVLLEFPWIVV
ncbi:MAG: metallophosphoesterase [Anaerolineae bacterium]|nr:metallophosphoesterase [Anaerolineae bacterium]